MSSGPFFLFNESISTDASMGADVTSSSKDISEANSVAVQAVWSAGSTPVGTTVLQASLDDVTFSDISSLAVSGNSGSNFFNISSPGYRYIRLKYTRTSGTATLNVSISAKRV